MRKEEEEEIVVVVDVVLILLLLLLLLLFHTKYDVIQSVFIVELYIRKIPYTKRRSKFLSSLRSKYPKKIFFDLVQFFNRLREAAFSCEFAGSLTYFTVLVTNSCINNQK